MRFFSAVFCLVLVSGCFGDGPVAPAPVNQEVTLAPGQSGSVPGTSFTVKFTGVSGDSRCPADALCILGGNASVRIEVAASGARREVVFETGNLQPVRHGGWTLELLQLSPYPFSASPIKPEDYRATLRITR
jgi:hypothetical protein